MRHGVRHHAAALVTGGGVRPGPQIAWQRVLALRAV